ncbi:MAG: hypothetical protein LC539_19660 [Candidatus Thiodiazotropha sp.]|nr:hypothetical protein [Candidatus Thiodiazotropha sp.]
MRKPSNSTTKAVTVRLSQADYADLLHTAENSNISIADTIRKSWRHYKDREAQSNERNKQTQELKRYIFECLSVTKGWDTTQRQTAIKRINERLGSALEESS